MFSQESHRAIGPLANGLLGFLKEAGGGPRGFRCTFPLQLLRCRVRDRNGCCRPCPALPQMLSQPLHSSFRRGPSEPLSGRAAERTSPSIPLRLQCLCVINGFSGIRLSLFFLNIILFLYVCDGPWLLLRLFSSCGGQGPLHICSAQASPCSGFSCCGARALGHTDFRSCGTRAQWSQFPGSRAQAQQSWCTG